VVRQHLPGKHSKACAARLAEGSGINHNILLGLSLQINMASGLLSVFAVAAGAVTAVVQIVRFTESQKITFEPSELNDILEISSKNPDDSLETYRIWNIWCHDGKITLDSRIHQRSSKIEAFYGNHRKETANIDFVCADYCSKGTKWAVQSSSTFPYGTSFTALQAVVDLAIQYTFDDMIVKKIVITESTGQKKVMWWKDENEWWDSRPSLTQKHILAENSVYHVKGNSNTKQFKMRVTVGSAMRRLMKVM
jgi:hypothetical protein